MRIQALAHANVSNSAKDSLAEINALDGLVGALVAAVVTGAIFGSSLRSRLEMRIQSSATGGYQSPGWRIFRQVSVFVISTGLAVLLLNVFGTYPLSDIEQYSFAIAWLLSVAAGKVGRYCLIRRKNLAGA